MDVIQLLITIVVVTILVTIVLAVVTYVAYKLRLSREPSALERPVDGPRYFVSYDPPDSALDADDSHTEVGSVPAAGASGESGESDDRAS